MLTARSNRTLARALATTTLLVLVAEFGCGAAAFAAEARETGMQHASPRSPSAISRRVYGAAQAAQNLVQTVVWDPFVRPYSTVFQPPVPC